MPYQPKPKESIPNNVKMIMQFYNDDNMERDPKIIHHVMIKYNHEKYKIDNDLILEKPIENELIIRKLGTTQPLILKAI